MPETEKRLVRIEEKVDGLKGGLERLETRVDKLEITTEAMGDDIKQIAEGHIATQGLINRRFDEVVALIDRMLPPFATSPR